MWEIKTFKTLDALNQWIAKHGDACQYTVLYVHNGYGVEFRKLRVI